MNRHERRAQARQRVGMLAIDFRAFNEPKVGNTEECSGIRIADDGTVMEAEMVYGTLTIRFGPIESTFGIGEPLTLLARKRYAVQLIRDTFGIEPNLDGAT